MHTWLFLCIFLPRLLLIPLILLMLQKEHVPGCQGQGVINPNGAAGGKLSSCLPSCPQISDRAVPDCLRSLHEHMELVPWAGASPLCYFVIYSAPVPPRCLGRSALCGGCDSLVKGQVHIFQARWGLRWLLWISSSAFLVSTSEVLQKQRDMYWISFCLLRLTPAEPSPASDALRGTADLAEKTHGSFLAPNFQRNSPQTLSH